MRVISVYINPPFSSVFIHFFSSLLIIMSQPSTSAAAAKRARLTTEDAVEESTGWLNAGRKDPVCGVADSDGFIDVVATVDCGDTTPKNSIGVAERRGSPTTPIAPETSAIFAKHDAGMCETMAEFLSRFGSFMHNTLDDATLVKAYSFIRKEFIPVMYNDFEMRCFEFVGAFPNWRDLNEFPPFSARSNIICYGGIVTGKQIGRAHV